MGLAAGFILVFAAACSSSVSTASPVGPAGSQGPGLSASPMVSASPVITASPSPTPLTADAVLSMAIDGGSSVKSFHLKITMAGTIAASAFASTSENITSDVKLDGTAIEGDVDAVNMAAHFTLNVPATPLMGNAPLTGDLIVVGQALYYKVSLLGSKYHKLDLGSLTSNLPVAIASSIPTPDASGMAGLTDEVGTLRTQMEANGYSATLVGVEQIGGLPAQHISISVPLDRINSQLASAAPSSLPMKLDSASFDVWIYTSDNRLAQIELKGSSASISNFDLLMTVSAYDAPVTITAPPAAQVAAS
jgi:hypothetical protein